MKVKRRSAKTQRYRNKAKSRAAAENAFKSQVRQAVEAVMNGGKITKMCKQYGVPKSIVQRHIKEERERSLLGSFQASTAAIPLNSKIPENIIEKIYLDKNTLKEQPKITQEENVQLAVKELGLDRDVVNKANVTTDLGTDENIILESPWELYEVEIETREDIIKIRQESLGLENDADCFNEFPQDQPTSPVKDTESLTIETSTKRSVDKQINIIDIRTLVCKTKEEAERDRRKALVDTWLAGARFDTMLAGDVSLLFTKFTSDGHYVNDHDYLRSPYMRCQMVEKNKFCVCMLCGKRQLMGTSHVKHMKKHETKCRLCNKQFDDIFLMNLHAYGHCYYCNECKTNVFYHSYDSHSRGRCNKPTKHYVMLAKNKAKNASGNTQTTPKQCVGEPSHGLKLLLEQAYRNKDPKFDKIWNLGSSTTEPQNISELLNSSVVPDNNQVLSKAGSELKIVNPDSGEKILLIDYKEEIDELCSSSKTKRDSTRPLKSGTGILVGSKAPDDEPSKEVLDNSNLPLLENPSEQQNSSTSDQDVSKANPKECSTSSKKPTNNKIVHSHNNIRNRSQRHKNSEIKECVVTLIKLSEEVPLSSDASTKPKLSKIPSVSEPNVRKNTCMDGTPRDPSVESSLVNSRAKRRKKSLLVPEDESIRISDNAKHSKTSSILENKNRTRRKSVFVPEEEFAANSNDACSSEDETMDNRMGNCNKSSLSSEEKTSLDETLSEVSSGNLTEPKRLKTPCRARRKRVFKSEVEGPKASKVDEPLKVSSQKTPSILQTKSKARSKSTFIPKVDKSTENPAGNTNEDSSKVSQTSMENRRKSVFVPESEEPKKSCPNHSPSKVTSDDLTQSKQTLEPKPRKRRKRFIPEVPEPKATSVNKPLKVNSADLNEPKTSKPRKGIFVPHVEESQLITKCPETTPKSRQLIKGVFMGDSHATVSQISNEKPNAKPGRGSNIAPLLDENLVLRLANMVDELKKRSLQAMEAQKKKWLKSIEENDERPKSTLKTSKKGEIVEKLLHAKKSSKSQEPINPIGKEVGPSVTRKKQKTVDPINQGKTKVAPVEKTKFLTVSLEAIERFSEETRIRESQNVKKRKYVRNNKPPKQIDVEDNNTFDSRSSTGLTDDYEVVLPENLTLVELFQPGAQYLGFTEEDDIDIEG